MRKNGKKDFVQIDHHSAELWKKEKGAFYEIPCIIISIIMLIIWNEP